MINSAYSPLIQVIIQNKYNKSCILYIIYINFSTVLLNAVKVIKKKRKKMKFYQPTAIIIMSLLLVVSCSKGADKTAVPGEGKSKAKCPPYADGGAYDY